MKVAREHKLQASCRTSGFKCRLPALLAAFLCVVAPAFGHGGDVAHDRVGKSESVRLAEGLTNELLGARNNEVRSRASERARLHANVEAIIRERHDLLRLLLDSNPQDVLRLALPGGVRAAFPMSSQRLIERDVSEAGELSAIHVDMPGEQADYYLYILKTAHGERRLYFAGAPTRLLSGSRIRVTGTALDADPKAPIVLANGGPGSVVTISAVLPNTLGVQSTLLILVNFSDLPSSQPFTPAQASAEVYGPTSDFNYENSYQQTSLTGDTTPWYTIAQTSTTCDYGAISTQANAAATAGGYNLANYKRLIYALSGNSCSWWGLGTIGGNPSRSWINSKFGFVVRVIAHEFGHNLGLYHSHSLDCGANVVGGTCTTAEYGDVLDVMGGVQVSGAAGHFNAFQKEQLGWLNAGISPPLTTVLAGAAQYSIGNMEAVRSATSRALKVGNTVAACGILPNEWYYIEKREPVGFDGFLSTVPGTAEAGVVLHRVYESDPDSSFLLDMSPATTAWADVALKAGNSFTDPVTGLVIQSSSVAVGSASVNVSYAPSSCANPPQVGVFPYSTQWTTPGVAASYSVKVTNMDSCGCPASSYGVSATPPVGWTVAPGQTAVLAPGANAIVNLGITPSPSTSAGFYTLPVTATDIANAAKTRSVNVTISVQVPTALANGIPVTPIAAAKGEGLLYTLVVPAGKTSLSFTTSGGSGDADLYVRRGSAPNTNSYDCGSGGPTTVEACNFNSPQAGTWYVLIDAYSAISGVSLVGQYQPGDASLSIADVSLSEGNSGTKQASFTVSLSAASANPVSFDIRTEPGTATPGGDYTSTASAALGIAAGQTSATFDVPVLGDTVVEGNETFTVNLSNPVGATIADAQAMGRINNDDSAVLSIADASMTEGASGQSTMSFQIRLSNPQPNPVTFDIATGNGTAQGGSDFVARNQVGRFLDTGRSSQIFEVQVLGDAAVESNETFQVVISNVQGATLGDGSAVGTIVNDDAPALAPQSTGAIQEVAPARPGARKASARAKTGVER